MSELLLEDIESLKVLAGAGRERSPGRILVCRSLMQVRLLPSSGSGTIPDFRVPDKIRKRRKPGRCSGVQNNSCALITLFKCLYVEYSIEYTGPSDPRVAADVVRKGYYGAVESVGLREKHE